MIRKLTSLFLLLFCLLPCTPSFSQCETDEDGYDGEHMDPFCDQNPDDAIPLDKGTLVLMGAGVLYGLKTLRKQLEK
jgi:hypothetical protein